MDAAKPNISCAKCEHLLNSDGGCSYCGAENSILHGSEAWECGHCHEMTTETHFYMDRVTGEMGHQADTVRRMELSERCGARFDDDYCGTNYYRCTKMADGHTHHFNPHVHWTDGPPHTGHIAPYDKASANGANA